MSRLVAAPASYMGASVLPVGFDGDGGVYLLLGRDVRTGQWCDFGGFREEHEYTPEATAAREFFEEVTNPRAFRFLSHNEPTEPAVLAKAADLTGFLAASNFVHRFHLAFPEQSAGAVAAPDSPPAHTRFRVSVRMPDAPAHGTRHSMPVLEVVPSVPRLPERSLTPVASAPAESLHESRVFVCYLVGVCCDTHLPRGFRVQREAATARAQQRAESTPPTNPDLARALKHMEQQAPDHASMEKSQLRWFRLEDCRRMLEEPSSSFTHHFRWCFVPVVRYLTRRFPWTLLFRSAPWLLPRAPADAADAAKTHCRALPSEAPPFPGPPLNDAFQRLSERQTHAGRSASVNSALLRADCTLPNNPCAGEVSEKSGQRPAHKRDKKPHGAERNGAAASTRTTSLVASRARRAYRKTTVLKLR